MRAHQPAGVTAVLVHGGFLGPWIWRDVVTRLDGRGIPSVCVDLPSARLTGGRPGDLHDDAQAVRAVLDGCPDVLLCGHSYAGAVVSEAAAGPHPSVRHLVFLAAAVPDVGGSLESLAQAQGGQPAGEADLGEAGSDEEIEVLADGRMAMRPDAARRQFFHDCPPDRADEAVALLRPQALAAGGQPLTGAAWRELPSTYIRCTLDRLPYELVAPGFFEQAADLITLPAGHCPQWSRPDLVADILAGIAGQIGPAA